MPDVDEFLRTHREVTTDAHVVDRIITTESRAEKWSGALTVVGIGGVIGSQVWDLDWLLALGGLLVAASWAVPWWLRRRDKDR